jgi:hypothetical protein
MIDYLPGLTVEIRNSTRDEFWGRRMKDDPPSVVAATFGVTRTTELHRYLLREMAG